ncbi:MAG: polysaccharide biosynthesis C-terminal domain-containing protein, partial [Chloroflexota bacterium]|nr:polysaccharide biosynthesis C-terminal domain-containing protein [Chloroflexota bacterium]
FCASVLNSYHRFAVAALAPLMYNLAIIAGAFFLSGPFGIQGLAIGAAVGAVLHLLVQVPALFRLGMRWRPIIDLGSTGVREVGRLFAPRVLGLGVVQFNKVLSGVLFASFLVTSSIAYLDYAWLMIMTPLALAMAVGTAVFPTLSEASALDRHAQLQQVFHLSLRMILFLTIPASIGLMVLGEPVIRLFFQHGTFNDDSTRGTVFAMVFFSIGLAGHATVEIVDRVFYALHDTRSPVLVAVGAIALNILLSLTLMQVWLGYDPEHAYGGLALANSIAALTEASVLIHLIHKRLPGMDLGSLTTSAIRMLAASLVMGLPVAWLAGQMEPPLGHYGAPGQAILLVVCVSSGALLYAVVSIAFRSDEIHTLWRLVRR